MERPFHLRVSPELREVADSTALRNEMVAAFKPGFAEHFGQLVFDRSLEEECMDLAFDPDPRIAFRAAYALEFAFFIDPAGFACSYGNKLAADYILAENPSVHRHYSKMLFQMLEKGLIQPSEEITDRIIEKAFDLLISPKAMPAVKVWSMDILCFLSPRRDWIARSLFETLQNLMIDGSPGIKSKGAKICRRLKKMLK